MSLSALSLRRERIACAAAFFGTALVGASFFARATPPCPSAEELDLTMTSVSIDGADQPKSSEEFFLFPRNDYESGVFLARGYDPDTAMPRDLELKEAP